MTLFYMYLDQDYKGIKKGGYYFNNKFKATIEKNNDKKILKLIKNDDYLNLFNKSINSISCIVGENGSGKTTFLELLMTNLLWGLDPKELNESNLTLFFYSEKENKYNFHLQCYRDYGRKWELFYKEKDSFKKKSIRREKSYAKDYFSEEWYNITKTPLEINMIFHNLSPFDNVYTLLKKKLSESKKFKKHYENRFRYIGVKNIESNQPTYEYMSIINLINRFFDKRFKAVLDELKYKFTSIDIKQKDKSIELPIRESFNEDIKKYLEDLNDYISDIWSKSFNIGVFNLSHVNSEEFKKILFFSSLDIRDTNKNTFEEKLFNLIPSKELTLKNLTKSDFNNDFFNPNNTFYSPKKRKFLKFIKKLTNESLNNISNFGKKYFLEENYDKKDEIAKILKDLKYFTINEYFTFEMFIEKPNTVKPIDYFQLSSGEKSFLTIFCNVYSKVNELKIEQNSISDYKGKHRTFIIIFDEVELHLHPEWQRKFIYFLNKFFISKHDDISFQFLIATHSPFVVSDLDSSQIIYLGQDQNEMKTFGGNIFDIFKRDFYVTNSIGAFSEEVIKKLSECLYFLSTCKTALDGNYFPLRDYIDEPYKNREKKEDENKKLKVKLIQFLNNKEDKLNYFRNIINNTFFNEYQDNKEEFFKKSLIIINKIGDEVISKHLNTLIKSLESFKVENYE